MHDWRIVVSALTKYAADTVENGPGGERVTRFQGLTIGAAASTLIPIAAGGIVRATGSGDGCPDWPRCFGKWIPPLEYHALIEYSHRTVAAVSGLVLMWLAFVLLKDYRRVPQLFWPGIAAFPLVVIQGWLGKLVVEGGLSPTLVTFHLANAMVLAGVLVILAVNSFFYGRDVRGEGNSPRSIESNEGGGPSRSTAILAIGAACASLVLILTGAYMRALGGALVFLDWPLMDSSLIPSLSSAPAIAHFVHRLTTIAVAVLVTLVAARALRAREVNPGFYRLMLVASVAFVAQAAIGAANVFTRLAPWARSLHVVFATLVWGALVGAATVAVHQSRGRVPLIQESRGLESMEEPDLNRAPAAVGEAH